MKKLLLSIMFVSAIFQSFISFLSNMGEAGLIQYGNKFVDEVYSPIAEDNLYYDSIFVNGITYTDKYQTGAAGKIIVKKTGKSAVVVGAPARDFVDVDVANSLITITFSNNYQQSRKIFQVAANAVDVDLAFDEFEAAVADVRESWQISGAAALADQGTQIVDATVITATNVKSIVVDFRKTLIDAKAKATTVLCNTDMYAAILNAAGAEFTPIINDRINQTGQVGMWLGMMFIEAAQLNEAAAKYFDNASASQTVDLTNFDFIMYDFRAYSILDNLDAMRIIDSELFTGSKAQVEVNSAFQVTNALRVIVKALT